MATRRGGADGSERRSHRPWVEVGRGKRVAVGDFAVVTMEDAGAEDGVHEGVVRVEDAWTTPGSAAAGGGWVRVRWCYFPEETELGRCSYHLDDEVVYTDHFDDVDAEAIRRPAAVLPFDAYLAALRTGEAKAGDGSHFICRTLFDYRTRITRDFELPTSTAPAAADGGGESAAVAAVPPAAAAAAAAAASPPPPPRRGLTVDSADAPAPRLPPELARAVAALQLSAAVPRMPCRDGARAEVAKWLRGVVTAGGYGGALYTSGLPGTGKTALVTEVVEGLRAAAARGSLPPFRVVNINGMKLGEPHEVYTQLALGLMDVFQPPTQAAAALDRYFNGGGAREAAVVVVDELDFLMTPRQNVLYNLFNWPQLPASRVAVVAIANTMDLTDRLHAKVTSRVGAHRLTFEPYNKDELTEVVAARLAHVGAADAFDREALRFAGALAAQSTGDVRRLLQICRKAVDVAAQRRRVRVQVEDIKEARKRLQENVVVCALRGTSPYEKLLVLAAHVRRVRESSGGGGGGGAGGGAWVMDDLAATAAALLTASGAAAAPPPPPPPPPHPGAPPLPPELVVAPYAVAPSAAALYAAAVSLHRARIGLLEPSRMARQPRFRLLVSVDDVVAALGDDAVGKVAVASSS